MSQLFFSRYPGFGATAIADSLAGSNTGIDHGSVKSVADSKSNFRCINLVNCRKPKAKAKAICSETRKGTFRDYNQDFLQKIGRRNSPTL